MPELDVLLPESMVVSQNRTLGAGVPQLIADIWDPIPLEWAPQSGALLLPWQRWQLGGGGWINTYVN